MIEALKQLGYEVSWSQGATPEELRDAQRRGGYVWEGDTHLLYRHGAAIEPEALQHTDHDAPGYVPAHLVLEDDSHEPVILGVSGFGISGTFFEDDAEALQGLIDSHEERVAELARREDEEPHETTARLQESSGEES